MAGVALPACRAWGAAVSSRGGSRWSLLRRLEEGQWSAGPAEALRSPGPGVLAAGFPGLRAGSAPALGPLDSPRGVVPWRPSHCSRRLQLPVGQAASAGAHLPPLCSLLLPLLPLPLSPEHLLLLPRHTSGARWASGSVGLGTLTSRFSPPAPWPRRRRSPGQARVWVRPGAPHTDPRRPGWSEIVHFSLTLTRFRGWWPTAVGSTAMGCQVLQAAPRESQLPIPRVGL